MSSTEALDAEGSAVLSDTALSALGLRAQPFAPGSVDGDTFTDDVTAEQLADIRQALISGDDLLLILGERGAGKSTLLHQLAANSGLRIQCFSVKGGPRFSTRNLFTGMLEAFKVEPPEDLKATLDELIPCLQAMTAGNKLCVVVLDDAEALVESELTTLLSGMLYVNSRDESLLRIALSAGPAFEERIPDLLPQGADLPYSSLSLEPFDADRAAAYLGFRLERAGRLDPLPLDEGEIAALNERAGGRPGALHVTTAAALDDAHGAPGGAVASAAVPDAALGPPSESPAEFPVRPDGDLPAELRDEHRPAAVGGGLGGRGIKLALGALAGALIVGGLLLFRPAPEPGATVERYRVVEQRKIETERETERLRLLQEKEAARATDIDPAPAGAVGADIAVAAAATDGEGSAAASVDGTASGSTDVSAAGPGADGEPADEPPSVSGPATPDQAAERAPDTGAVANEPASAEEPDTTAASGPAPDPSPTPDPSPPPVPEPVADASTGPETGPEPESGSEPGPGTEPGSESAPPGPDAGESLDDGAPRTDVALLGGEAERSSPVAPPAAPVDGALESPNWVLVQDPEQFTVQMSASTDRASVEQFLERAALPAPNSIFTFDRDGRTWFALVHGLYPSIADARTAIERMPAPALTNQPWIRAVGRIQETLRERN